MHGEIRHLVAHARLAGEMGIPRERIAMLENGLPLILQDGQMTIGQRVAAGEVLLDGSRLGEVSPAVLLQRDGLAQSGFVTAVAPLDRRTGNILGEPRIVTSGFVHTPDAEKLLAKARAVVSTAAAQKRGNAVESVEKHVEKALSDFLFKETRNRPVVTVALVTVDRQESKKDRTVPAARPGLARQGSRQRQRPAVAGASW